MGWYSDAKDYVKGSKVGQTVEKYGAAINPVYAAQVYGKDWASDVGDWAGGIKEDISGETAADAAGEAAAAENSAQLQQLEYLKEINALPQQYKEEALTQLQARTQPGGRTSQADMFAAAESSPMFAAMMSGRDAGEESILRNAGATGGLRSGNVQSNMYDYNTKLRNEALMSSFGEQQRMDQQGLNELRGLAGIQTGEQAIGQTMGDIGRTTSAGILGQAQAQTAGTQNMMNMGLGIAGLFI